MKRRYMLPIGRIRSDVEEVGDYGRRPRAADERTKNQSGGHRESQSRAVTKQEDQVVRDRAEASRHPGLR